MKFKDFTKGFFRLIINYLKRFVFGFKKTKTLLFFVIMIFHSISCGSVFDYPIEKEVVHKENWEVFWEDNFEGNDIDTTYWSKTPRSRTPWARYMTNNDSCYEIKNGTLILKGLFNDFLPDDTATYLTGGIYSKDKKHFTFGKIEVKAKIKKVQGAWPAIWTNTKNWPIGGEIDIMESINHDDVIYQTLHSGYTINHKMTSYPFSNSIKDIDDKSEYNIYGVIIDGHEIVFTINNKITLIYPKIETLIEGQYPYGNEKFLLLSMQLNHETWTGPVRKEELPAEIYIDWVRYYKKKDLNIPNY